MSTDFDDIEALLAGILDDSQPLPVPTEQATIINVAVNAAGGKVGDAVVDSPESFLEDLMQEPNPGPMDVAQAAELRGEMALADALPVTQSVTEFGDLLGTEDTPQELGPPMADEYAGLNGCDPLPFKDTAARQNKVGSLNMPTFTAADFADTMDIRNFATLVTLNTARWHAKVKDRQASKDAATMNEADERSFETRKRLLVGADELLRAIHKAIDEARAAHYEMTLPWTTTSMTDQGRRTGGRLLPNTLFVEYTTVMAKKKQAMTDALNKFLPEYPQLVEQAKAKLGKRFDVREYPNPSSIRSHFDLSFDFQPIPKGDDFKGLPQAQLDALAAKVNDNTRKQAENAMQDVWVRLREAVGRMAERLASPDKMFHDSLVQNVRDAVRLTAHLNITNDQRVEDIRQMIDQHLCKHEPKVLRNNMVIRAEVAGWAASVVAEMDK